MKLRSARARDLQEIIALHKTCFEHAWKQTGRRFHRSYLSNNIKQAIKKDATLVLEDGTELKAFAWAKKEKDYFGNRYGDLAIILVHPLSQNQGIGTRIVKMLEKKLGTKDTRLSVLETNPSRRLYSKAGYKDFMRVMRKVR